MQLHPDLIGFGAMELCIKAERPPMAEAQAMLLDLVEQHGLRFIDTADAYSLGEEDFGYGEELVAPLMKRSDVLIATKGGFTRPGGAWVKQGDPEYIKSACKRSLQRLGVDSLPLYQFHQPDPNVPFEETLGAFIDLKAEGKVQQIGVSNFSLEQLKRATEMTEIVSIQNPLSILFYNLDEHRPMLRFCEEKKITFFAYAPFGGHRNKGAVTQPDELKAFAHRAGMDIYQFALAFLKTVSPAIVPIPGSLDREHILHNLNATGARVPNDIMDELMAIYAE